MTVMEAVADNRTSRKARPRHYLMCPPTYFSVTYAINPWMNPNVPVNHELAEIQWDVLRHTYMGLGHTVDLIDPEPDLPDMVFAANGGLVAGGRAYSAKFRYEQRQAESQAYRNWLKRAEIAAVEPIETNEGEGDFLTLGSMVLGGSGFRTSIAAHIEAADAIDRPVVSLELVDARFYHLDTCLAVLDDGNGPAPAEIAYYPAAFSRHSQRTLRDLFPNAIICSEADALVLGLNAVSDGHNVVLPAAAVAFGEQLRGRGYNPVPVNLGELLKAGGSVKCCTLELHA